MIEIGVLGPLLVRAGDEQVAVAGRRERCVLGVLGLRAGHVVSVTTLLEYLWGDHPPRTAQKSLQTAVANVRRALRASGDDVLETAGSGYLLAVDREQVDVGRFEKLVTDGRAALDAGMPETAAGRLTEALALWRGDTAADFGDGLPATIESSRLDELRLDVVADRVDADLRCGRHLQVLPEVAGLAEAWPLRERIHELLMVALYRAGRQSDALAAYERLRTTLLDQGLDPCAEVRELQRQILDHDPDLAAPPPGLAGISRSPSARGRAPATRLLGRDEAIQSIGAVIRGRRLVTLVGPGGVGKTALAEHVADHTPGLELVWCGLGAVSEAEDLVPAVATVLGVDQRAGVTMLEAVCNRLSMRPTLLVLDNCEHLLDPIAALVESLLRACESLIVLATSRERLSLAGEAVWPVEGLAAVGDDAMVQRAGPAVALFVERARESDPFFDTDGGALAYVAAICRRLDGLPLAIELAAARVRALPLAEIAKRLDDRFTLLDGGRGADERHHSLRATVAWSYDLLAEREQRLFRRVGTFAGAFSLEAAEAVGSLDDFATGEVAALLADLVDKSMVAVTRAEGMWRYRVLETLRAFAREELDEHCESEAVDEASLAYYADLVQALAVQLAGTREVDAVRALEGAFDNVRQCVAIARRHEDADMLTRLVAPLMGYLHFRPHWEASTWADQALALFGRTPPHDEHSALVVAALAAWGHWYGGDLDRAESIVETALASAPEEANRAELLASQAVVLMYRHDHRAVETAERALTLVEAGDRSWLGAYLAGQIAIMHAYTGEPDRAEPYLARQADLVRSVANHSTTAWSLYCRAEVSGEKHPAQTIALARRAVEEAVAARSSLLENITRITAVTVEARHGDVRSTLPEFARLVDRFRRSGAWTHLAVIVWNLIEALAALEEYEAAAVLLHAAPEAAPMPYGDQLSRLDAVLDRLSANMDEADLTRAALEGSLLTREEVAEFALERLAELAPG